MEPRSKCKEKQEFETTLDDLYGSTEKKDEEAMKDATICFDGDSDWVQSYIIKGCALIANKKFFNFLDNNIGKIINLKSPVIEKTIYNSCLIKKKFVEEDEKEKGLRKVLNLGHTFAHAYESSFNYSRNLNHGEAVLLGIMTAIKFSFDIKLIKKKDFDLIEKHLQKSEIRIQLNKFFSNKDVEKIVNFMKTDKKNTSKKINLVLLKKISKPVYNINFDHIKLKAFLRRELNN